MHDYQKAFHFLALAMAFLIFGCNNRESSESSSKSSIASANVVSTPIYKETADQRQASYAKANGLAIDESIRLAGGVELRLRLIPPGEYDRGSASGDPEEAPVKRIEISSPFYMGVSEVTVGQFRAVCGSFYFDDSRDQSLPATPGASELHLEFCDKLSKKTGRFIGLPSEAEWEYAARADSTSAWHFGEDRSKLPEFAWCGASHVDKPQPVCKLKPNQFGLFDMLGNVWERCLDGYEADYYKTSLQRDPVCEARGGPVLRGGSFATGPRLCRSAYRKQLPSSEYGTAYGFRVILRVKASDLKKQADGAP